MGPHHEARRPGVSRRSSTRQTRGSSRGSTGWRPRPLTGSRASAPRQDTRKDQHEVQNIQIPNNGPPAAHRESVRSLAKSWLKVAIRASVIVTMSLLAHPRMRFSTTRPSVVTRLVCSKSYMCPHLQNHVRQAFHMRSGGRHGRQPQRRHEVGRARPARRARRRVPAPGAAQKADDPPARWVIRVE